MNLIQDAIEHAGGKFVLATECGLTYQALNRWLERGYLPRSELTGETNYSSAIERATRGKISAERLRAVTRKGWKKARKEKIRP